MACCSAAITGPTVRAARARPSSVRVTIFPLCAPFPGLSATRPFFTMAATAEFSVCLGLPSLLQYGSGSAASCVRHQRIQRPECCVRQAAPLRRRVVQGVALIELAVRFVQQVMCLPRFLFFRCLFLQNPISDIYYSPDIGFMSSSRISMLRFCAVFTLRPCKSGPPRIL